MGHVEHDLAAFERQQDRDLAADDRREAYVQQIADEAEETLRDAIKRGKPTAPVTSAYRGKVTATTLSEILSDLWDAEFDTLLCAVLAVETPETIALVDRLAKEWGVRVADHMEDA